MLKDAIKYMSKEEADKLLLDNKREQIAYMLVYYSKEKELLSCNDLFFGIQLLLHGYNPFLNKDFVSVLNADADKKNYPLSHEVFRIKLPGNES